MHICIGHTNYIERFYMNILTAVKGGLIIPTNNHLTNQIMPLSIFFAKRAFLTFFIENIFINVIYFSDITYKAFIFLLADFFQSYKILT